MENETGKKLTSEEKQKIKEQTLYNTQTQRENEIIVDNSKLSDKMKQNIKDISQKYNLSNADVESMIKRASETQNQGTTMENKSILENGQQTTLPKYNLPQNQFSKVFEESAKKHQIDTNNDGVRLAKNFTDKANLQLEFEKLGKKTLAVYKNGRVIVNADAIKNNPEKVLQNIVLHEAIHGKSGSKELNDVMKTVLSFAKSKGEYESARLDLDSIYAEAYKGRPDFEQLMDEEVVTNTLGEYFGTEEGLNELINYVDDRTTLQKIYDFVKDIINRVTGYKDQEQFFRRAERQLAKALQSDYVAKSGDRYFIQTVAEFNENEYNNARRILLGKTEFRALSDIINSDSNIRAGINLVETTNATYTVYFKETGEFKVLSVERDLDAGELSERNDTARGTSRYSLSSEPNIENTISTTSNDEISNINTKGTGKRNRSNTSGTENIRNEGLEESSSFNLQKNEQYKIIQETNPAPEEINYVWIRRAEDIKTWKEVLELDDDEEGQFVWGDFSREDAEKALKRGTVRVYSSYPIKNGVFVSTSYQQALDYAGGEPSNVHSRNVALDSVAWINGDEGQYAKVKPKVDKNKAYQKTLDNAVNVLKVQNKTRASDIYYKAIQIANGEFKNLKTDEDYDRYYARVAEIEKDLNEKINPDIRYSLSQDTRANIESKIDRYSRIVEEMQQEGRDSDEWTPYANEILRLQDQLEESRYSYQTNGKWQEFVDKYFSSEGTKTKLGNIRLPQKVVKMKDFNDLLDRAINIPQADKKALKSELKGVDLTPESLKEFEQTVNDMDKAYKEFSNEILNTNQNITTRKATYNKYNKYNTEYDNSSLEKAKEVVPANKQGRRTKEQWLNVAKQIGTEIANKTNQEIEEIAYRTWQDEAPNQKSSLNRQGEKYIKFTSDEWVNTIYNTVKEQREKLSIDTNKQLPQPRRIVDEVYKEEIEEATPFKRKQYEIIQKNNPMFDDEHVGIRSPADIKTFEEVIDDKESFTWGDFSVEDAKKALKNNRITIYSSYPIKQGVFVSTSRIQAEQYAGGSGSRVYSKVVPLKNVAWINGDEGQYANTSTRYSQQNADWYDYVQDTFKTEGTRTTKEQIRLPEKNVLQENTSSIKETKTKQETDTEIAKVLNTPVTRQKPQDRKWAIFKASVFDKGIVFEDLSKRAKNRELEAKWDYTLSSSARAQYAIGNARLDENGNKISKGLTEIIDEVGDKIDDFQNYMYHLLNIDRMSLKERFGIDNKPVFGKNIGKDYSERKVKEFEKANTKFKEWAQDVYDYANADKAELVKNGVISQELSDKFAEMYPHYVPIQRANKLSNAINLPLDTRRTGVNTPIKQAKGGSSDLNPLFETLAGRTMQTYRASARNSLGVELKNTLESLNSLNSNVNDAESLDSIMDTMADEKSTSDLLQASKDGKLPTFTVFENGNKVTFDISEDIYDALIISYQNLVANYNLFFSSINAFIIISYQNLVANYNCWNRIINYFIIISYQNLVANYNYTDNNVYVYSIISYQNLVANYNSSSLIVLVIKNFV